MERERDFCRVFTAGSLGKKFRSTWGNRCIKHQMRGGKIACVLSPFSWVQLFVTLWTVACQAPLSMGFSMQNYLGGLPSPSPGDLPDPGIESTSLVSPALQAHSLPAELLGKPEYSY